MSNLASYAELGRGGLRVSPLGLGTDNFGPAGGVPEAVAVDLLARYFDAGGNFVDTSDAFRGGTSEPLVGDYLRASGRRHNVVLAARYSYDIDHGGSRADGNTRPHIERALEASLRRLRTDYIDLYWLKTWDGRTPVDDVLTVLDDLVRAGKVRHVGLVGVPAWYVARGRTLAELRGTSWFAGLQLPYSLMARHAEIEHIPAALALGVGVCSVHALAGGLLTGKYRRSGQHDPGPHRLLRQFKSSCRPEDLASEPGWRLVESLVEIAAMLGRTPAQIALNWALTRPGINTTLLGVTRPDQLAENLGALEVSIPEMLDDRLEAAFRPTRVHPYGDFTWDYLRTRFGRAGVLAARKGPLST